MRHPIRNLLLLLLAVAAAATVLLAAVLQDRPLAAGTARLTPADIERAKQVLSAHDPRRAGRTGPLRVALDERDLSLALNYLAGQRGGSASLSLRPGEATVQASFAVMPNPFGRYLNVDARLRERGAAAQVVRLRVGAVPMPGFIAEMLLPRALAWLLPIDGLSLAAGAVQSLRFEDGRLLLVVSREAAKSALAQATLVGPDDLERLHAYHERLCETLAASSRSVSLTVLMPPLFDLALERGAGGDQPRENRAAIVVLALYSVGISPGRVAPAAARWCRAERRAVTLAGREDFPKHFLLSAAIAAEAGSPLADAIGVYKEVEDSRSGSGFSFQDIGADRAGTRFGEVASLSPARARELAQAVASGVGESDLMPDVSDLPEFLPEAEFKRRFGGVDGPGYRDTMAMIDARIAALPLLRR